MVAEIISKSRTYAKSEILAKLKASEFLSCMDFVGAEHTKGIIKILPIGNQVSISTPFGYSAVFQKVNNSVNYDYATVCYAVKN